MKAGTIKINGSDEVMAPLGSFGTFFRGRWRDVKVTRIGNDSDTPFEVRKSLVGLTVPIIFDKLQLDLQGVDIGIPEDSALTYSEIVIDALQAAGKYDAADQMREVAPNPLDMYLFERGTYELV